MSGMRGLWGVLVAGVLVACGEDGVTLTRDRDTLPGGGLISVRLHNGSDSTVRYELCSTDLEREEDRAWVRLAWSVWRPAAQVCPDVLLSLAPGASDSFALELPSGMGEGTYRFVTRVGKDGAPMDVASAPFRITAP